MKVYYIFVTTVKSITFPNRPVTIGLNFGQVTSRRQRRPPTSPSPPEQPHSTANLELNLPQWRGARRYLLARARGGGAGTNSDTRIGGNVAATRHRYETGTRESTKVRLGHNIGWLVIFFGGIKSV